MGYTKLYAEDYEEPRCPLCNPNDTKRIPIGRITQKLDEYLSRNDYSTAEQQLKYWLGEAESSADGYGALSLLNELMGLYRKISKKNEAVEAVNAALFLAQKLDIDDTVFLGTTFINAATVYKAFEQPSEALELYRKARQIYEKKLPKTDSRLAGLYNNMGVTVTALGDFSQAHVLFEKALEIMSHIEHGEGETAVTYCNIADLINAEHGAENGEKMINDCLDKAFSLLETQDLPQNGSYAFICEKCAPTFGYYGYFFAETELKKRAREIYERT